MTVRRTEGWPERLAETVEAAMTQPFSWEAHNCGLFVADCCLAMTGVDPAAGFLRDGRLGDESSARWALQQEGARGGSLGAFAALIARRWGAERVAPAFAQRGDIMVVLWRWQPEGKPARRVAMLGICWNGRIAAVTPYGLTWLGIKAAHAVWRIRD